ncbi:MAG: hypothetical protein ACLFTQ_03965 [Candidatus Aenigmatarchaeota archaeon]
MSSSKVKEVKSEIYSAFSNTASAIGYDEVHGRIIAALIVNEGSMTLQELADETGYSSSSISLSLDLLEVFGIIKKIKKQGDRKLYVNMDGDLLDGLKKAVLARIQKSIPQTLENLENYEERLEEIDSEEARNVLEGLKTLEGEVERLEGFVDGLAEVEIPEDEK